MFHKAHLIMNLFYYVCPGGYIQIDKVLLAELNAKSCSKDTGLCDVGSYCGMDGHNGLCL